LRSPRPGCSSGRRPTRRLATSRCRTSFEAERSTTRPARLDDLCSPLAARTNWLRRKSGASLHHNPPHWPSLTRQQPPAPRRPIGANRHPPTSRSTKIAAPPPGASTSARHSQTSTRKARATGATIRIGLFCDSSLYYAVPVAIGGRATDFFRLRGGLKDLVASQWRPPADRFPGGLVVTSGRPSNSLFGRLQVPAALSHVYARDQEDCRVCGLQHTKPIRMGPGHSVQASTSHGWCTLEKMESHSRPGV